MLDPRSNIPQIDMQKAPKDEQQSMWLLNISLTAMEKYVKQFGSALHLFDYCHIQQSVLMPARSEAFRAWTFLACRDAVMSIWHFRQEMFAANNYAFKSAYVRPNLDVNIIHEAHAKFERDFPEFAGMRHAIAHAGELKKNEEIFERNAFSGSYEGEGMKIENSKNIMIQENLSNRTFVCTHEGKIVRCDITGETIAKMAAVMNEFYAGFRGQPASDISPTVVG